MYLYILAMFLLGFAPPIMVVYLFICEMRRCLSGPKTEPLVKPSLTSTDQIKLLTQEVERLNKENERLAVQANRTAYR